MRSRRKKRAPLDRQILGVYRPPLDAGQLVDEHPVDAELVDEHPVDAELVDEHPVDDELVDEHLPDA